MTRLVLLGGGGHASDVLSVVEALVAEGSHFEALYVADDHWERPDRFLNRGVAQRIDSIAAGVGLAPFVVAVGYPVGRRHVYDVAAGAGGKAADSLVHPAASVGVEVALQSGVVVMGQSWLSPRVKIKEHTHVGYGATLGHDTQLGAFCSIMPGACVGGDVVIGDGVLVGANATVLQGLTLGDGAVIGAGAVVINDIPPGVTVVGNPARATSVKREVSS